MKPSNPPSPPHAPGERPPDSQSRFDGREKCKKRGEHVPRTWKKSRWYCCCEQCTVRIANRPSRAKPKATGGDELAEKPKKRKAEGPDTGLKRRKTVYGTPSATGASSFPGVVGDSAPGTMAPGPPEPSGTEETLAEPRGLTDEETAEGDSTKGKAHGDAETRERYGAVGRKRPRKEAKDDGPASGVKRRKTVKQPAGNVNSAPGVLSNRPGVLGTVGTSTLSAGILNAGAPVTGFGASTLQTAPPSSGWEYVGINRPGIFPTGGWQPSYTYPIAPSASGLTASAPPPWAPAGGPATGYVGTGTFNGGSASASTYNGSQVAGHPFNNGFIDTSILDTPWAVYAPMNCYIVPGFDMDKGGQRNTRN
ncbi:hypothetical protein EJ06DRAFT_579080 [Trichodelitschia bisporula]|uniref:Uncharacterized protein n=1 Tax=Trichodelitschia bisporula TaxID=703511 RepID=A0A6G1I827_9PEZI|nr:hypothetical protein EJ06DRAFT_579080 [Trichodelitschia bisporula]